jgi:uroporphyrin-III C-methyltransferase/precorrin-2 dehydrogenase/sirohydrochlorin ferrochelatase
MFPLIVDLTNRPVLVIGGGTIGMRKAAQLIAEGARVTVLSDVFLANIPEGVATVITRPYLPGDLDGFLFVVAATANGPVNDQIWAEAIERNILCNVVDDLSRGDTYFAALHTQGPVRVAVTTSGTAPALAQALRDRIAHALPSNLAEVAAILEGERRAAQAEHGTSEGINWRPRIEELLAGLGEGDSDRCDDGRSDRGSVAS